MKFIITTLLFFICFFAAAHVKGEGEETAQNEQTELKKHPHLTIKIDSIGIDDQLYAINFKYEGKIKNETGLLYLNDSIALNVIYLKMKILGKIEYFSSFDFYRLQTDGTWKAMSYTSFFPFTVGSYTNGWGSIGTKGYPGYFRYKMYIQFS